MFTPVKYICLHIFSLSLCVCVCVCVCVVCVCVLWSVCGVLSVCNMRVWCVWSGVCGVVCVCGVFECV